MGQVGQLAGGDSPNFSVVAAARFSFRSSFRVKGGSASQEEMVPPHPILALLSLAILTSSGPGSSNTAGTSLRASNSSAACTRTVPATFTRAPRWSTVRFVADLLWDVLGPIGITAISAALLFIGVEAVRWWLGG
jgi:hypothetical protein